MPGVQIRLAQASRRFSCLRVDCLVGERLGRPAQFLRKRHADSAVTQQAVGSAPSPECSTGKMRDLQQVRRYAVDTARPWICHNLQEALFSDIGYLAVARRRSAALLPLLE